MDLNKLLDEYLNNNELMQLATVSDEGPWLCNVYFVSDNKHNLYWTSARKRRHSKEIKNNSKVAATIVQDPVNKQALQITGNAFEVSFDDIERVIEIHAGKYVHKPSRLKEVLEDKPDGLACWVLKPETIFFSDEVNFPDSPKQEV